MSIPRLAIQRPVTMFMISAVITLLGAISLTRLPVDLMPEFEQPTLTVRTNYAGVGPLEMEELDHAARRAGRERRAGPRCGGIHVVGGQQPGAAQLRLGRRPGAKPPTRSAPASTACAAACPRTPTRRTIFKFDSNAQPICSIGVEGDFDPVTLREIAQNELAPRFERVDGVAAVTVNGGLRRQIHVELSKEKITALNLSVDRVVQMLRQENQNTPLGEIYQGDATFLRPQPGPVPEPRRHPQPGRDDARGRARLPARHRRGQGRHRGAPRSSCGSTASPASSCRSRSSPARTPSRWPTASRREKSSAINREVPGIRADRHAGHSRVFIERAINNVQEHAMVGGILVVLIIFAFLRDFRSTLIVCTSIPVSVIGTFALLYFGGFTLNTMTFGGLALGIGMIVDAAIVVLENTHRHLHMGKDRMTAAIDGSEEVWSAILASTLTHIAVFIPLLFLSGTSSILFTQLSVVVMFSLAMSLFVAVTIVPVLCSRWLQHAGRGSGAQRASSAACTGRASASWSAMDEGYRKALHVALAAPADRHRRRHGARWSSPSFLYPTLGVELLPQTDEGEVNVNAELAVGTRIERTEAVMLRLEEMVQAVRARGRDPSSPAAAAAASASAAVVAAPTAARSASSWCRATSARARATRSRRTFAAQLSGLPGVVVRANPAGGNFQLTAAARRRRQDGDSRLRSKSAATTSTTRGALRRTRG